MNQLREFVKNTPSGHSLQGEFNLVVATGYGKEGLIPYHKNCNTACISENGRELCHNYWGHENVNTMNGDLSIVQCAKKGIVCK